MFGYVTIYHKGLEKPELDRYQAYYCGLCRTLGQKYGLPGQLTLSYDLAFICTRRCMSHRRSFPPGGARRTPSRHGPARPTNFWTTPLI